MDCFRCPVSSVIRRVFGERVGWEGLSDTFWKLERGEAKVEPARDCIREMKPPNFQKWSDKVLLRNTDSRESGWP